MKMICQNCNTREANIQTQQIGPDGRTYLVALCHQCFETLRSEGAKTSVLNKYGRDLTELANQGKLDPVIGREKELERLTHILTRRTKNNPVLIGDPGVGKTAIIEGLAQKIVKGEVVETLYGKRIFSLDLTSLVSGAAHRGEFEKRLKETLDELISLKGQTILFIDELHTIVGAGSAQGSMDAANILKPALARGEIQVIGATTLDEYRMVIERDGALERRFQPIIVEEPTIEETISILRGLKSTYERHHNVIITDEIIELAIELGKRYLPERYFPDKAIDIIDEACAAVRMQVFKEPTKIAKITKEINEAEIILAEMEVSNVNK